MQNTTRKTALILLVLSLLFSLLALPGLANTAAISGTVFEDRNDDGKRDAGEDGLVGVTLSLIRVDGASESIGGQAVTGKDGFFQFQGLKAGNYYLQAQLPNGYFHSLLLSGSPVMLPAQGQQSRSPLFAIEEGKQVDKSFGGSKRNAYINIIAFGDSNMNGGRMSNEPLLKDVQVELVFELDGQQHVVARGMTDKKGELQLKGLSPASYRLAVTMPEPYIIGPLGAKINPFYNIIPPTENNRGISAPFVLERSLGVGVGGVKAGTLQGSIWLDSNMDGKQDAGEGGMAGLEISLTHTTMGVSRTLTTGNDASFVFEHLQAGEYQLSASLPEGFMFAQPGSPSLFTDAYKEKQSQTITVREGERTKLKPIGLMPTSGILLTAFHDSNVNGQKDEGEPVFAGATVEVLEKGQVKAAAVTDSQGLALLPRVKPGAVTVQVKLPDGQIFSVDGGEQGNAFSSAAAASTLSVEKTLDPGGQLMLQAGATLPASIKGQLFEDSNLNSLMDADESGLAGFAVQAINNQGQVAAETTTANDGSYLLSNLVPGSYQARFLLVSPFVFSQAAPAGQGTLNKVTSQTPAYGQTEALSLSPGAAEEGVDAGAFRSAVLKGTVLLGDEETGFDGQAGGLAGVVVQLLDQEGQPVSEHTTATTDETGAYSLKGALPGHYSLSFTLPEGAKFSQPLTEAQTLKSEMIQVKASDELNLNALYAVKTGSISGQAFVDLALDGSFDEGDAGLPDVQLQLTNQRTQEVYQAQSDANGQFALKGMRPGIYSLSVTLPEGLALSANEHSLVPAAISGASSAELAIAMGQNIQGSLLAAVHPITVKGTAFYDNDLSGSFDPQLDTPHALQLTLTHEQTQTVSNLQADANGQFAAGPLFPGRYLLSIDLPEDHLLTTPAGISQEQNSWTALINLSQDSASLDLALVQLGSLSGSVWNMDGSKNDLGGLVISLQDETGAVQASATTDEFGSYTFSKLMPGSYTLSTQLKEQYRFARSLDTGARPSVILSEQAGAASPKGSSQAIKLSMGEQKTGQDIGIGAMGQLGDFAWLDLDQDGMQDGGEPGIPGLEIRLYQYGQLTAQTTTDDYGRYAFDSLFPGSYTLEVTMPGEIKPTRKQTDFLLVASVLEQTEEQTAKAEGIIVPSGGRNLNADLGFVLRQDGKLPAALKNLPTKDWTQVNQQKPSR